MAKKSWTLLDLDKGEYISDFSEDGGGVGVTKKTLRGGLSDGVDVINVTSGDFSFTVIPTRGMSIWKAWSGEESIGWKSPVRGPVHPGFVPIGESSGLGWLDGFDELLVRCGLESNGAPEFDDDGRVRYPLHGRIGNKPAHRVTVDLDDTTGELTLHGVVEETRFHFFKARMHTTIKTKRGEAGFRIRDVVENISGSASAVQMLYHVNFGLPLLDAGSQVVAPARNVVPRNDHAAASVANWSNYAAEQAGYEEQVYFFDLYADNDDQTQVLLKNAHGTKGVSMHYNVKQLPCFSQWKNTTAAADGYVTGLEPGTNYPNPRTYEGEQGRVAKLAPGGKAAFDFKLAYHSGGDQVERAEAAVKKLQKAAPKIYDRPQKGWCEGA